MACAGERATGYGVALLNTLFGESSQSSILQMIAPIMEVEPNGLVSYQLCSKEGKPVQHPLEDCTYHGGHGDHGGRTKWVSIFLIV
jgi:hypothetical protein